MHCFAIFLLLINVCLCFGSKNAYISFEISLHDVLKHYSHEGYVPVEKRFDAIQDLIAKTKDSHQSAIEVILSYSKEFKFYSYWVTNTLVIEDTDEEIVSRLKQLKGVSETRILDKYDSNQRDFSEKANQLYDCEPREPGTIQWNIQQIKAPEVWDMGFNGTGVTVGTIGSGSNELHIYLKDKFRGNPPLYGFYEPAYAPYLHEHQGLDTDFATLRIALAVADAGYGVAPSAKFMCCGTVMNLQYFFDCVQWMMCPHNGGYMNGTDHDCSKAPNALIISNVQDKNLSYNDYENSINMLTAMGITVVTEVGTSTASDQCQTISAACSVTTSICVGFTNINQQRSFRSPCGPSITGQEIKPDLLVPGLNVSGLGGGDPGCVQCCFTDQFGTASGSGHALGVIALILSKNVFLKPEQIKQILINASRWVEDESYKCCNFQDEDDYPNFCSGYGLLDAKLAIELTPDA